jgi:fluoroacetyl-CoA thioesterase
VKLIQVEGGRLVLEVEAHDGIDLVSKGTHERFVIDRARFSEKVQRKFHP